jgi:hypothetical protein
MLRGGFVLLLTIGIIDSATRMSFLTFLPFLLQANGAGTPEIGLALSLLFAGGAAGKLVCGFLGGRLDVLPSVLITEGGTAVTIMALLPLPLSTAFVLLRSSVSLSTELRPSYTEPSRSLWRRKKGKLHSGCSTRPLSVLERSHRSFMGSSATRWVCR